MLDGEEKERRKREEIKVELLFFTCLCKQDHWAWLVISRQGLVTEQADNSGRSQDVEETVSQLTAQCIQERVLISSEVEGIIWLGSFGYWLGKRNGVGGNEINREK